MTLAEALRNRLKIYRPKRCPEWKAALETVTDTTDPLELFLILPKLQCGQHVVPTKLRRRWFYRQLELARKAVK